MALLTWIAGVVGESMHRMGDGEFDFISHDYRRMAKLVRCDSQKLGQQLHINDG